MLTEIQKHHNEIKAMIVDLTGITEEQYCEQQYKTGMYYLETHIDNPKMVSIISKHKLYWSWWRTQWVIRDAQYIKDKNLSEMGINEKGELVKVNFPNPSYCVYHNYINLSNKKFQLGKDLHKGFAQVISLILKDQS